VNDLLIRRAALAASSWDPEARTATAVLSTGAGVQRMDRAGEYEERLALEGQVWPPSVPLLDSHRHHGLEARLGSVTDIRAEGGELRGVVRLSRASPAADRVAADLADGHGFSLSVGYRVDAWRQTTEEGRRVRTAFRWHLLETSIVHIPADPAAGIRSDTMIDDHDAGSTATEGGAGDVTTRAAQNAQIRAIGEIAGLDRAWADSQIDAEATVEAARAAAFDAMRARQADPIRTTRATVGTDFTDPEVRARTIGEALYTRVTPGHTPAEAARQYAGHTILDIARDCLRHASVSTTSLAPMKVIERALHSTSDFPLILGDTVGRTLRASYQAAPSGLKAVGRRTTARDFRAKHRLQLSEAPRLESVGEGGEFRHGSLVDASETYRVATFGKIISISRQALINDDVGAFSDIARRMGQAALATEAALLVDLLEANSGAGPTMADDKALFHADHGNLEPAGAGRAEPGIINLAAARLAMRKQVGLSGELIAITPKYLIVPAELEIMGEDLLAPIFATKTEDLNLFARTLQLVVEPRFSSAARWYLAATPGEVDGLEYAYLEGEEGPQIETRAGFEVDGVQVKVRLDFGCGFVDHRGWFQNPGS